MYSFTLSYVNSIQYKWVVVLLLTKKKVRLSRGRFAQNFQYNMQIYEEVSVYQFVFYTMFFGTDSLRDEINCKTIFISMQIRPQKFLSKRYQKTDSKFKVYQQRP